MAQETLAGETSPQAAGRSGRRRPSRGGLGRLGGVVLAGLLLAAAFPPVGLWPLAPVSVALSTLVVRGSRPRLAAGLGFTMGFAFCLPLFEGLRPVGFDAWIVVSIVEAVYFAPMAVGVTLACRLPGWPVWTAGLWVAEELVRGRVPFGGFPWGRLAFSQASSPLTGYASLGGAPFVSFMTALAGGLLAAAILAVVRGGPTNPVRRLVAVCVSRTGAKVVAPLLAGALAVGAAGLLVPRPTDGEPITVAVVQGNVPRLGLDAFSQRKAVLNNHANETHKLAREVRAGTVPRPDIVIWPENSSDLDPYRDADARATIDAAVRDIGVPTLIGAVVIAPDGEHLENRGIVWDPETGPGDYYVKRHPLPFGEYIPIFPDLLKKVITRFDRVGEYVKGHRDGLLRLGSTQVGDVICFEVAYDGLVRDVSSAPLLVVQTNNATFGGTGLPDQQFAMSRLRAVEHGRTVLVAATSGVSGIVAPDGRVVDRSKQFTPDIQVARVPLRTSRTLADHLGAAPEWGLALLGTAAAVVAAVMTRKRRTDGGRRRGEE